MKDVRVFLLLKMSWCCISMPMQESSCLLKSLFMFSDIRAAGIAFYSPLSYAVANIDTDLTTQIALGDVHSKKAPKKLVDCSGSVTAMCAANNLKMLCVGLHNNTLIYDIETGKRTHEYKAHTERVNSLSAQPQFPHLLISGSDDKSIKIYDLRAADVSKIDCAHEENPVTCVRLAGKQNNFLSCAHDKTTKLWDWNVLRALQIIKEVSPLGLEYNRQSDRFMIYAFHVSRYNAQNAALMATFNRNGAQEPLRGSKIGITHSQITACASCNTDEQEIMAIGRDDGQIVLCCPEDPTTVARPLAPLTGSVNYLAFSSEGDYLISAAPDDKKLQVHHVSKKLLQANAPQKRSSIKGYLGIEGCLGGND